ncbi:MAG: hypothetical protein J5I93_19460 [Pirellulaceae bacterium]|nr:hypothetical protein [Pirellulaceae bacterium]
MSILVTCPHCQTTTEVPANLAGQSGPCRECGRELHVPWPTATRTPRGQRLRIVVRSGMVAGTLAGLATLLLFTLPELGPVSGVLQALVAADPADEDYRRLIVGHGALWFSITGLIGFLTALLVGIVASAGIASQTLDDKCLAAGWGCLGGILLATLVALLAGWYWTLPPTTQVLAVRLIGVLACGALAAAIGFWHAK